MEYANVPNLIAVLAARKMASLRELQTYYSYDDALDLYEILLVTDGGCYHCAAAYPAWRQR